MTQPPPGYGAPGYGPPGYGPPPAYGPPPGYRWAQPPAPRPGCVPLRPLGVGDILDGTFTMIRRNPQVMLGLSATVAVLQLLLLGLFEVLAANALGGIKVNGISDATSTTGIGPLLSTNATNLVTFAISLVLGSLLTGMLTIAITQDVIGVKLTLSQAWERVRHRMWPLLGLVVIAAVGEFLGLLALLVLGVWLWGIWAVAVPVLMVEGTTIRGALGRSRLLVTGTFWRVWGIRALGTLIASVIGAFIAAPFVIAGAVADSDLLSATESDSAVPIAFIVLVAVGSAVSATFTAPIRAGIDALLYVDLRMRKEGLDIVLQQSATRSGSTPPPRPQTAF